MFYQVGADFAALRHNTGKDQTQFPRSGLQGVGQKPEKQRERESRFSFSFRSRYRKHFCTGLQKLTEAARKLPEKQHHPITLSPSK